MVLGFWSASAGESRVQLLLLAEIISQVKEMCNNMCCVVLFPPVPPSSMLMNIFPHLPGVVFVEITSQVGMRIFNIELWGDRGEPRALGVEPATQ